MTRLDLMVKDALGEEIPRVALMVVRHAEVARDAVRLDPLTAGLLPCTTDVYEVLGEERVHVHHRSENGAVRDLGVADGEAVDDLVDLTGDLMDGVWAEVERLDD